MEQQFTHHGIHLSSIYQVNALPTKVKHQFYRHLIPQRVLAKYPPPDHDLDVQINSLPDTSYVEVKITHPAAPRDPVFYVQIADTVSGQLEVVLLRINDPLAPRFEVDRYWQDEYTKLNAMKRNIAAEVEAMHAGLGPGQVRRGLGLTRELIPAMERFIAGLGKDCVFIEPLTYHTAILFERYGFAYMTGQRRMEQIDHDFQPRERLFSRLDGSTPFRQPGYQKSVLGRSWAIHDRILDEPWSEVKMYKRTGHAAGMDTFSGTQYAIQ